MSDHHSTADLARLLLAWNQGDHDTSQRLANAVRDEITPDHELWSYYHWALLPVFLYQGDTENLASAASVAALDEGAYASMRAESVALWAIGLHYSGDRHRAAEVLAEPRGTFSSCPRAGGSSPTPEPSSSPTDDPELAIIHLENASREAAAADDTFVQRLTEVSQLVLLISRGHRTRGRTAGPTTHPATHPGRHLPPGLDGYAPRRRSPR